MGGDSNTTVSAANPLSVFDLMIVFFTENLNKTIGIFYKESRDILFSQTKAGVGNKVQQQSSLKSEKYKRKKVVKNMCEAEFKIA